MDASCLHMEALEGELPVEVPHLKVTDFMGSLLSKHPRVVFGGFSRGVDSESLCETFWQRYQLHHPEHCIYNTVAAEERRYVLPICLHGDKGRGHGKSPVFVFSWESVFALPERLRLAGSKSDKAKLRRTSQKRVHGGRLAWTCAARARDCMCAAEPVPHEGSCSMKRRKLDNGKLYEALQHNSRGNTILTRFLISAVPSKVFKANPEVIESLLDEIASDLKVLFERGLTVQGRVYRAAVVGIKGDYEFLVEAGRFDRHYGRVGTVREQGMCPECHAGDPGISFEDFSDNPTWAATKYLTDPWLVAPALLKIPFATVKRAQMFRRDVFHTLKYGFCRDLSASLLVLLGSLTYFDHTPRDSRSIDSRLERAYSMFALWCAADGRSTTLKKFSKANIHRKTENTFPWLGGKGSDTVLCMMFLLFMVRTFQQNVRDASHTPLLRAMEETLRGGLDFIGVMHSHDLFLPRACAGFMMRAGYKLLRGYSFLADFSIQQRLALFSLRPKCHYFHHMLHELGEQISSGHPWILSPSVFNCEANEDFIGRISRLSRKVSPKICSQRVIDRYLVGIKLALNRAGV